MLTTSDLEINVLEFRQRSFQFDHLLDLDGSSMAVFTRTETESESRFRPKLVHLTLVVPLAWVVLDAEGDALRIARDGATVPPRLVEPVIEVAAEPTEFREQGIDWRRIDRPGGGLVYAPAELSAAVLGSEAGTRSP